MTLEAKLVVFVGHQINFYATPTDIAALEAVARSREPLLVLHDRSRTAEPRVLASLDHHDGTQRQHHFFLVREPDLAHVVTEQIPTQGYWIVDVLRSPAIEFSRCFFDGKILRRGRIYWVDGFYADGSWVEKPESFRTWAKRVRAATKKALTKYDDFEYIGADARAWLERDGGRLVSQ